MPIDPADYFGPSLDDLREVARFAVGSAEDVLAMFEQVHLPPPAGSLVR